MDGIIPRYTYRMESWISSGDNTSRVLPVKRSLKMNIKSCVLWSGRDSKDLYSPQIVIYIWFWSIFWAINKMSRCWRMSSCGLTSGPACAMPPCGSPLVNLISSGSNTAMLSAHWWRRLLRKVCRSRKHCGRSKDTAGRCRRLTGHVLSKLLRRNCWACMRVILRAIGSDRPSSLVGRLCGMELVINDGVWKLIILFSVVGRARIFWIVNYFNMPSLLEYFNNDFTSWVPQRVADVQGMIAVVGFSGDKDAGVKSCLY